MKPSIANLSRVKDVVSLKEYLDKKIISKKKIICELNEPYKDVGSISIIAKDIQFSDPNDLILVLKLSDNMCIYPRTDGKIQMDFMFYDLTTTVD